MIYDRDCSGSANNWWERSSNASNATNFCNVNSTGTANNNNATNANGVRPGFYGGHSNQKAKIRS